MTTLEEKISGLEVQTDLVLMAFHADWCASCQLILPILNKLEMDLKGKLSVLWVDIDQKPEVAEKYGVKSIPTILLLKEGNVADHINGVTSLPLLMERIEKVS